MTEYNKVKAFEKMENYENTIVIHNEFNENLMASYFQLDLVEFSITMAKENGGDWNNLKKLVETGEINWTNSGFDYKIYLQDSVNIDVISDIINSQYASSIIIDPSEWEEKHQEMMLVDAFWKIYNSYRSFETSKYVRKIEKSLNYLKNINCIFKKIDFSEINDFVKSIENFDEKQILFWIRLK